MYGAGRAIDGTRKVLEVLTELMVTNVHVNLVRKANTVMKVRKKIINSVIQKVEICYNLINTDIDDCENQPCIQGKCTDRVNGYECTCDPGWEGTNCEKGKKLMC